MDKTIELVNSVKDIQAMPSVIVKTLNLMKKPTVSMKELGDLVDKHLLKLYKIRSKKETFKGYGPEQGYMFLRNVLQDYYKGFNVKLDCDEIFVSDGAKSDLGNILDLFDKDNVVLIPDPVYPAYVDTNVMDGRKIIYSNSSIETGFLGMPDYNVKADLIYICSPNNPTGAAYNREQLTKWVEYAKEIGALILFDAAYEAFIESDEIPHSIYEIPGAKKCAIEVCSLSKTAGFTGLRCGYTIVPHALKFDGVELNKLWLRRQTTKYNGVPEDKKGMSANSSMSMDEINRIELLSPKLQINVSTI